MKCNVDIPYPTIMIKKKDPQMARMIMHSYAGDVSEDTAIHQYMFQSVILKKEAKEIAEILEGIAFVEMRHLKILAELIRELGVYPIYLDPIIDQHEFWSAKYVNYETDIKEILLLNMEAERQAILQYNSLIHVIETPEVKVVLKRIVLDERLHLEIFEKLLQSFT
jgi:bacterioferritin